MWAGTQVTQGRVGRREGRREGREKTGTAGRQAEEWMN